MPAGSATRRSRRSRSRSGPHSDFWLLGLLFLGTSSILASLNFLVTILNLRAPGMTFLRLPLFVWTTLVTNVLILLAFPPITVALIFLMFDRFFGTPFYIPGGGGLAPPLAAPLLDLRPPGGLHPDPPGDGHRLRGAAGLRAEAALRLPLDGLRHRPDRLPGLRRLGPPHVRRRHGPDRRLGVRAHDDAHLHPDRDQDLQLAVDALGRLAALPDRRSASPSRSWRCSPSAGCRASCTPRRRSTSSRPTRTSSWRTSTTCSSAAWCWGSSPGSTTGSRR